MKPVEDAMDAELEKELIRQYLEVEEDLQKVRENIFRIFGVEDGTGAAKVLDTLLQELERCGVIRAGIKDMLGVECVSTVRDKRDRVGMVLGMI